MFRRGRVNHKMGGKVTRGASHRARNAAGHGCSKPAGTRQIQRGLRRPAAIWHHWMKGCPRGMNHAPLAPLAANSAALAAPAGTGRLRQHPDLVDGRRRSGARRGASGHEYPEFHQPEMSATQAEALALNRCNAWGFSKAEPIEGQIRQCANVDDGNCNLWSVTREFQCSDGQARYATRLSR